MKLFPPQVSRRFVGFVCFGNLFYLHQIMKQPKLLLPPSYLFAKVLENQNCYFLNISMVCVTESKHTQRDQLFWEREDGTVFCWIFLSWGIHLKGLNLGRGGGGSPCWKLVQKSRPNGVIWCWFEAPVNGNPHKTAFILRSHKPTTHTTTLIPFLCVRQHSV